MFLLEIPSYINKKSSKIVKSAPQKHFILNILQGISAVLLSFNQLLFAVGSMENSVRNIFSVKNVLKFHRQLIKQSNVIPIDCQYNLIAT